MLNFSTLLLLFLHFCLTLCNPIHCSAPGSSVHGILQARIPEGSPCPPPGNLPNPGTEPISFASPALAGGFFTTSTTWESVCKWTLSVYKFFSILPSNITQTWEIQKTLSGGSNNCLMKWSEQMIYDSYLL